MPKGEGGTSAQATTMIRNAFQAGDITRAQANRIGALVSRMGEEGEPAAAQREATLAAFQAIQSGRRITGTR